MNKNVSKKSSTLGVAVGCGMVFGDYFNGEGNQQRMEYMRWFGSSLQKACNQLLSLFRCIKKATESNKTIRKNL